MMRVPRLLHHLVQLTCTLLTLLVDAAHFLWLCLHSPTALAAENLFLRKQLALYQERQVTPRRATDAIRLALLWRLCNLRRFSAGIGRDSDCSSGGSPPLDARRSLRTCKRSSVGWPVRIPHGVRSALPMNSY
jgi:hypothetical protein